MHEAARTLEQDMSRAELTIVSWLCRNRSTICVVPVTLSCQMSKLLDIFSFFFPVKGSDMPAAKKSVAKKSAAKKTAKKSAVKQAHKESLAEETRRKKVTAKKARGKKHARQETGTEKTRAAKKPVAVAKKPLCRKETACSNATKR